MTDGNVRIDHVANAFAREIDKVVAQVGEIRDARPTGGAARLSPLSPRWGDNDEVEKATDEAPEDDEDDEEEGITLSQEGMRAVSRLRGLHTAKIWQERRTASKSRGGNGSDTSRSA